MNDLDDLLVGTAAEHLVCADILLHGYKAFLSDQNCAYDIVIDHLGKLIRVQVKSTRTQRNVPQRESQIPAYMWNVRRAGKAGKRLYEENAFDVLALVALDIRRIAYMPAKTLTQSIHIRPPGTATGKQFDDYPFGTHLWETLDEHV